LAPGDQRPDVQRDDPAVAQGLGHVAGDDALGQALDDRRLAHAGLADEDGVVLGAPRQDLDDPADLVVAPDHRVELAELGGPGQVAAEALQGLVGVLGALVGDPVGSAHLAQRLEQALAVGAGAAQRVTGAAALGGQGEQQVLGGDVLVLQGACLALGGVQDADEILGGTGRLTRGVAAEGGQCVHGPAHV